MASESCNISLNLSEVMQVLLSYIPYLSASSTNRSIKKLNWSDAKQWRRQKKTIKAIAKGKKIKENMNYIKANNENPDMIEKRETFAPPQARKTRAKHVQIRSLRFEIVAFGLLESLRILLLCQLSQRKILILFLFIFDRHWLWLGFNAAECDWIVRIEADH